MTPEEQLRRQLRFALFLQVAGATMFAAAFVIRLLSLGFDVVTALFGAVALLIATAAAFTRRKFREVP